MAPPPILFLQSGSRENALRCIERLKTLRREPLHLLYVTHRLDVSPEKEELPDGTEILVTGSTRRDLSALAERARSRGVVHTVLMLTGEAHFTRYKLFAWTACRRGLLLFDERGDPLPLSIGAMAGLWFRRLRQKVMSGQAVHLTVSAWRLLRDEGLRYALRRAFERLGVKRRERTPLSRRWWRPRIRRQTFPRYDDPELSIVIPVHNQEWFTFMCLRSIRMHGEGVRYEIIVADDGSGPATAALLRRQRNVRTVRLHENQGFVAASNAGAAVARAPVILFLNNDAEVRSGTLRAFLDTFKRYPRAGAVGAMLIYPDGVLQEAGGIIWRNGVATNFGRYHSAGEPPFNYVREVDYCSGAALAVPRELFEQLRGFDAAYAPGYWEDTDLCFRARKAGYHVLYQPKALVVHSEGTTSGNDLTRGMKAFQEVNQEKFHERWESELAGHLEENTNLFLARDRRRGRIILVIDHYVPTPDRDAGSYGIYQTVLALRSFGYRVLFWPDNRYRAPRYTEDLQQRGIEVLYGGIDFQTFMAEAAQFIDTVIMHRAYIAEKYLPLIGTRIPHRIYMCCDLEHLREARKIALDGGDSRDVDALRAREAGIASRVHQITVYSSAEKALLSKELPDADVSLLPLPVRPASVDDQPFPDREGLLFVGSSHPPNADAVMYFHDEISAHLAARLANVRLTVAGEVANRLQLPPSPNLEIRGFVPDLSALYASRRVVVAPLRYGAGMKGKILEAMTFGVPVVTTSIGAEGIAMVHGVSGFIADTAEDFARAIERLYTDEALWMTVRNEARSVVARDFSDQVFVSRLRALVDRPV